MPIKRAALIACLSLLAACSPQAADSTGEVAADAVTQPAVADSAAAAVAPAADEADAAATLAGTLEGNKLGITFTQPTLGVTGQGNFWLQGDSIDGRMSKDTEPGIPFMWTGTRRK